MRCTAGSQVSGRRSRESHTALAAPSRSQRATRNQSGFANRSRTPSRAAVSGLALPARLSGGAITDIRESLLSRWTAAPGGTIKSDGVLRQKWIAAPLSLLFWATCVAVVIAWTPFVLLYRAVTFPFDRERMRVGRIVHNMAVTAANLNPFWTFEIVDPVHPDPRKPYVFVANHS